MKTLAGMQWAIENLKQNDYFTTADDDVLINPLYLKQTTEKFRIDFSFLHMPIVCMYDLWLSNGIPDRNPLSKYYVSYDQYNEAKWPKFCPGGLYTLSISIATKLYEASRTTSFIPVDDVWVTGILRNKINIPDTMVLQARPRAATHFMGFYLALNKEKFKRDWKDISTKIMAAVKCVCYRTAVIGNV